MAPTRDYRGPDGRRSPNASREIRGPRGSRAEVPKGHIEEGFALGDWVAKRRFACQQGRRDPEHSPRLEQLPGWRWTLRDDRWRPVYDLLLASARREGHALVRQDWAEEGVRLGVWVGEQRRAYKQGRLNPQRASLLASIPGWSWDPCTDSWDRHHEKLVGFAERTGGARVPERHVEDGVRVGQWVRAQRRFRRRGRLPEDRATRLEALSGWSWGGRSADRLRPNQLTKERSGGSSRGGARPEEQDDEWVDAEGAASMRGVSHQTVYRLIQDGRLPASRRAGQVQILRADVVALIESSRIVPGSLRRTS